MGYGKGKQLLTSSSSNTSPSVFVGDCRLLSLSVQSLNAGASTITVSLSNNAGFGSADSVLFYSVVTLLPAQGIFTLDPGARWLKVERASASTTTVILNRYFE